MNFEHNKDLINKLGQLEGSELAILEIDANLAMLEEQRYLNAVIYLANSVEKILKDNSVKNNHVIKISVNEDRNRFTNNYDNIYTFNLELLIDEHKITHEVNSNIKQAISGIITILGEPNLSLVSEDLADELDLNGTASVFVTKDIKKTIIDTFLNKELLTKYNYIELNLEQNGNTNKKNKVKL